MGDTWAAIHVGNWQHPELVTFTPGPVVVEVHAIPADVMWWVTFERLEELKPSQGVRACQESLDGGSIGVE